jgi:hypothetical protein
MEDAAEPWADIHVLQRTGYVWDAQGRQTPGEGSPRPSPPQL